MSRIGIDVGGSFTDAVLLEPGGRIRIIKVPSTLAQIETGFMDAMRALLAASAIGADQIGYLAHGTTVATNAFVERKFARTALVTIEGFTDVLSIGTQMRTYVYDIWTPEPPPSSARPPASPNASPVRGMCASKLAT